MTTLLIASLRVTRICVFNFVIILDTHIWIWWVEDESKLLSDQRRAIQLGEDDGIGISVYSCWEVAKGVERGRIVLPCDISDWMGAALNYPGTHLLNLTPEIAILSTQLPGTFHRDPADQILVATAIINDCPLLTADKKIREYTHVQTI